MAVSRKYQKGFLLLVTASIAIVFTVNINQLYMQRHRISGLALPNRNNVFVSTTAPLVSTLRQRKYTSVLKTLPTRTNTSMAIDLSHYIKDDERSANGSTMTSNTSKVAIVILTDERSGSTLLGELFNKNPTTYYQFEPFVPYTSDCSVLEKDRIEMLGRMLKCNFSTLNQSYRSAFNVTKFSDRFSKCVVNNMCFYERNSGLTARYAQVCQERSSPPEMMKILTEKQIKIQFSSKSRLCGLPFKIPILSELCLEANAVVYKVIRICSIASVMKLLQNPPTSDINLRIIHLVRDPRAVISSRFSLIKKQEKEKYHGKLKKEAESLCQRHRVNLQFDQNMITGESQEARDWERKYLRVRYEDMAKNLSYVSSKIYRFLDRKMPQEVKDWILEAQPDLIQVLRDIREEGILIREGKGDKMKHKRLQLLLKEMRNPFSVKRDPRSIKTAWRRKFASPDVFAVQDECRDVMLKLGYNLFSTQEQITNYSLPTYNDVDII